MHAHGSYDGEGIMVDRKAPRRRLTDAEVLADRDLLMAEWRARGRPQDEIARRLNLSQPFVSERLAGLPKAVRDGMPDLVRRHPDGIPEPILVRLRNGLLDYRHAERVRRDLARHRDRTVA